MVGNGQEDFTDDDLAGTFVEGLDGGGIGSGIIIQEGEVKLGGVYLPQPCMRLQGWRSSGGASACGRFSPLQDSDP